MTTVREITRLLAFFALVVCVIIAVVLLLTAWYLEKYVNRSRVMSNEITKMLRRVY